MTGCAAVALAGLRWLLSRVGRAADRAVPAGEVWAPSLLAPFEDVPAPQVPLINGGGR